MPPDMAINMRRTKLKAEEAALLAGELKKPTWESRNEGIHERVSFEDAIWGFDLAGGAYYKTPLRVVAVKPDSRAEKAGIRPGDKLTRINDVDTSTLTIQEAHKMIIDSGIHLRIAVSAPEDEEDQYFCYEDPLEDGYDSEEERWKMEEMARKRQVHAKVSSYWSLQWPWVSKRRVIYRESNCFMVPSKYEDKHKDKFSPQERIRTQEDIVLGSINSDKGKQRPQKKQEEKPDENPVMNGDQPALNDNVDKNNNKVTNGAVNGVGDTKNGIKGLGEIPEIEEEIQEDNSEEIENSSDMVELLDGDKMVEETNQSDSLNEVLMEEKHDEIINQVLKDEIPKDDVDKILDSILSDEEQVTENSDAIDER